MAETPKAPSHLGGFTRKRRVLAAAVIAFLIVAGVFALRVQRQRSEIPAPAPMALEPLPADPLTRSALSGKNQLAADLVPPKLPEGIAGFPGPEDTSAGTADGGAALPDAEVENVVRGKKLHVIDVTGWGVVPPQGFVQDEGLRNAWKPASGAPADSRIFILSGPACRPSCAGQPVSDDAVARGIVASRRAYDYRCPSGFQYGGKDWKHSEFSIVKLSGESCVTMGLLTQTSQGRQLAAAAFLRMRDSLQPLPRRPRKPMLEEQSQDRKIPLLR